MSVVLVIIGLHNQEPNDNDFTAIPYNGRYKHAAKGFLLAGTSFGEGRGHLTSDFLKENTFEKK